MNCTLILVIDWLLLLIIDLPRAVSHPTQIRLFADDAKVFRKIYGRDYEISLQNDLKEIYSWRKTWLLGLNLQKCKAISFGKSSSSPKYTVGEGLQQHTIEAVSQEKDLGVTFDQNLTFRSHIESKIKVASRSLALIRHSFKYLDKKTFILLYKSLVRPHLEYCMQSDLEPYLAIYGHQYWKSAKKGYKACL